MASLLRAQLAHARLYPASEHPELPPATATALPTRPQSPRVTRRLQPKSTSAFPLSLLVLFAWSLSHPSVLSSTVWACVMSTLPARIPCVASAVAAGLCHDCLRKLWVYLSSAQLGSFPSRWPFLRATSHTHTHKDTQIIFIYFTFLYTPLSAYSQHLPWSKGSEMMHRIGVDSCTRVFSGWPQPQSHFPTSPCCHCARRAAASSGTQHPILEPTPNPWRS